MNLKIKNKFWMSSSIHLFDQFPSHSYVAKKIRFYFKLYIYPNIHLSVKSFTCAPGLYLLLINEIQYKLTETSMPLVYIHLHLFMIS